ncbi:polygalacturonase-like [Citrus sinensis]|uniref:polygalacturonase-like n=1 Tax=Citrus sinensis TaxID=2711 RepID=UPI002279DD0A|nr:polygalacturonase-like [Citrus sinensis]
MVKFFSSLFIFLFISSINLASSYATTTSYNVLRFGAKGNGVADSTQAFAKAWAAACASTESATINVPKGRYLLGYVAFNGDCKSSDITFRIDGTLVAPADYCVLGQADNWLSFEGVSGVSIIGGALDAKGSSLWACKASGTNCPDGATVLHNCLLF